MGGGLWCPLTLLVIAKYPQVLFQGLIGPLGLSVIFRVVSRGEVELHVKCFSEGAEKSGNKLETSVRGYMFGNAMLREDMHDEYGCKVFGRTVNCSQDENALFG